MMKLIRHKRSASTIQSVNILENKIPEMKKIQKMKTITDKTRNRLTYINNTVLDDAVAS